MLEIGPKGLEFSLILNKFYVLLFSHINFNNFNDLGHNSKNASEHSSVMALFLEYFR